MVDWFCHGAVLRPPRHGRLLREFVPFLGKNQRARCRKNRVPENGPKPPKQKRGRQILPNAAFYLLFLEIAGAGFEPTTFGLWVRHPWFETLVSCGIHYLSGFSACQPCQDFRFKWFCGPKMARKNPQSFPPVTKKSSGLAAHECHRAANARNDASKNYAQLFGEIKTRINTARIQASISVNRELINLYLDIGQHIMQSQAGSGWVNQLLNGYRETYVAFPRHARVLGQESLGHAPPLWELPKVSKTATACRRNSMGP